MRFENAFDVQAPIDEVYATLLDVERVAPCLPGAQVLEQTGDSAYKVAIRVKLGPMSMQYRGDVEIVERDPAAHSAVMRASAREARGQGTAEASVRLGLSEGDGMTHATMVADVQLSGKAAAMGQGIVQDVSARLVDQFAANLATMLEGGDGEAEEVAEAIEGAAADPSKQGSAAGTPPPPPRKAPEPDAMSATDLAGAVIAGRLRDPKTLGGLLGLVGLIGYLLGRRRRS